jgi:hypothetical protein
MPRAGHPTQPGRQERSDATRPDRSAPNSFLGFAAVERLERVCYKRDSALAVSFCDRCLGVRCSGECSVRRPVRCMVGTGAVHPFPRRPLECEHGERLLRGDAVFAANVAARRRTSRACVRSSRQPGVSVLGIAARATTSRMVVVGARRTYMAFLGRRRRIVCSDNCHRALTESATLFGAFSPTLTRSPVAPPDVRRGALFLQDSQAWQSAELSVSDRASTFECGLGRRQFSTAPRTRLNYLWCASSLAHAGIRP